MTSDYIIWGIPKGENAEVLLVSENAGLRDRDHAEKTVEKLSSEYGCTKMRIVKLEPLGDGSEIIGKFSNTIR